MQLIYILDIKSPFFFFDILKWPLRANFQLSKNRNCKKVTISINCTQCTFVIQFGHQPKRMASLFYQAAVRSTHTLKMAWEILPWLHNTCTMFYGTQCINHHDEMFRHRIACISCKLLRSQVAAESQHCCSAAALALAQQLRLCCCRAEGHERSSVIL